MTDQEILDNAPEGASVSDITGEYFDEYNNHLNKQGFWSEKDTSPVSPRSLEDIRRIVELEKERNVEYIPLDDRQLVYLTVDDLNLIKLEQQAKGVERVLCENSLSLVKRERMVLKRIMKQLHEKAKALKEQLKP